MSHVSQVRQNFHKDCEDVINKQINLEFFASYTYISLAAYFDRDDVALPGFSKYFKESSAEESGHAWKLIEYMNKRGGHVVLSEIAAPEKQEWGTAQEAMHAALELEKSVNEIILHLAFISTVLQSVYLLPVELNKPYKKRSIDDFLTPFDIEYKPLHLISDAPVSFQETIQYWNSLADHPPDQEIVVEQPFFGEFEHGQFSSFSNNPGRNADPFLLVGIDAKRAAHVLYSKELFFSDFPHERALLYNEMKRKLNGLSGNKLGSLRPTSSFFRGHRST